MSLKRYIDKCNEHKGQLQNEGFGYENCKIKNTISSPEMEELSTHIKTLAEHFYGFTRNKCRALIMEYAVKNNV